MKILIQGVQKETGAITDFIWHYFIELGLK